MSTPMGPSSTSGLLQAQPIFAMPAPCPGGAAALSGALPARLWPPGNLGSLRAAPRGGWSCEQTCVVAMCARRSLDHYMHANNDRAGGFELSVLDSAAGRPPLQMNCIIVRQLSAQHASGLALVAEPFLTRHSSTHNGAVVGEAARHSGAAAL